MALTYMHLNLPVVARTCIIRHVMEAVVNLLSICEVRWSESFYLLCLGTGNLQEYSLETLLQEQHKLINERMAFLGYHVVHVAPSPPEQDQ